MKKLLVLIFILVIGICIIPTVKVNAKTLNDLYKQLDELKERKANQEKQKNLTIDQINTLTKNITDTTNQINQTQNDIAKATQDIKDSEEKIKQKEEETKELIKFLQLSSGENVYLDYLFEADSYTDFIYRYSVVKQLSQYNSNLMDELKKLIDELEANKVKLAGKEKDLKVQRENLEKQKATLGNNLTNINLEGATIEQDIADMQKEIVYYRDTLKCSPTQDLTSCANIPYSSGWKYPVTKGYISSVYQNNRCYMLNGRWVCDNHLGTDFAGNPEWTNVYATAPGKVARLIYKAGCGGNVVYIYHNVNGRNYTTATMHLIDISVSVGQIVNYDTVIGHVGGGSGTPWDGCSTGAHVHYGIADGHNANDFNSYTFDSFNIFPKLYYGASFNYR